jgi:hypothetical protein
MILNSAKGEIMTITPEMMLALVALIGSLTSNLVQYLSQKGTAKKSEADASGVMIEMALKLNRSEMDTLRQMNQELKEDLHAKDIRIDELEERITDAMDQLSKLKSMMKYNKVLRMAIEAIRTESTRKNITLDALNNVPDEREE